MAYNIKSSGNETPDHLNAVFSAKSGTLEQGVGGMSMARGSQEGGGNLE